MSHSLENFWLDDVEEHDYPAAESYLSLIYECQAVLGLISKFKHTNEIVEFKAKDVFRASGLALAGVSNAHVVKDLVKIKAGKPLSPLLLVRDPTHGKVVIADGFHRMCALYALSEDAIIRCKIV